MSTLYVDTSTAEGVVAWYGETTSAQREFPLSPDTGRRVLAAVAELTGMHEMPDAVAVCVGPGQRAGALRAGVAAAGALAWAWGVSISEVPAGRDPAAGWRVPPGAAARPRY